MKHIIRAVALVLLPILLYFALFVAFEPNNYFGLRAAPLRGDDIIAAMRQYEDAPTDGVVVGDSRFANMDVGALTAATGVEFANLAFGGASLTEELDMVEWLAEQNPNLKQLVLGLSYYTLNAGYSHDRMVVEAMRNPFVYMTNLTYNVTMLETLKLLAQNAWAKATGGKPVPLGGGEDETRDPASYVYTTVTDPASGQEIQVREDLLRYATEAIGERGKNWKLDEPVLARLCEILLLCEQKGIEVTVVLPPADDSVWELVIGPNGIEQPMLAAIQTIRDTGAVVLDYEFTGRPPYGDEMFFDGFHLDAKTGLPVWTRLLVADMQAAWQARGQSAGQGTADAA